MGGPYWLHKIVYFILLPFVWVFCKLRFNLKMALPPRAKGPCLIVANHNTDYDMLFVGCSFWRHMYFVGSEHIYRWGFLSKIIWLFFAPIARFKGSTDGASAMGILKALRKGRNVCIFAEGNRSFNGLTTPIHPTIGKLAKMGKANLVIYRLEGGYFTSPRWSTTLRRGQVKSVLTRMYTAEELRSMTPDEINAVVSEHIHEDAYALQDKRHVCYWGKKLAEGLETALYICPRCGGIQSLKGKEDDFICEKCGLKVHYTEYGYLQGENAPFRTVTEWDAWQSEEVARLVENAGDGILFSDEDQELKRIDADHNAEELCEGTLSMTRTALTIGSYTFPLEEISTLTMYGRQNLIFTVGSENYEIKSDHFRSARKYLRAYELLTGKPVTL